MKIALSLRKDTLMSLEDRMLHVVVGGTYTPHSRTTVPYADTVPTSNDPTCDTTDTTVPTNTNPTY